MPPKRGRRSYEPEARDDMYTSSEEDGDAAWEPKGRRGRRASTSKPRKRSRSVGPSTETVSASPLLGTITPKRNRSRSATPGSSTIRRGPLPFERLPLPLPPLPQQLEARRLVLFGSNSLGQLGLGTHALKAGLPPLVQPERHPWFEAVANQAGSSTSEWSIEAAACGSYHTLVLTKFGSILSWGVNELGAIGRNTEATPDGQSTEELETQPLPVELSSPNFRPTRIACGDSFSLAVSDAGELRFWGSIRSSDGLLSATPNSKSRITKLPSPIADAPREPVVAVATGCDHAILLTAEGHIYTFGNGQQGQLGRKVIERRKHHGLVPEKLALGRKSIAIGAGVCRSALNVKWSKLNARHADVYQLRCVSHGSSLRLGTEPVQTVWSNREGWRLA